MMKIVLLHDVIVASPRLDELESLEPIENDKKLLEETGHEVELMPLGFDLRAAIRTIQEKKPDFVFNFVESIEGIAHLNHLAPMVLELAGVPYSGCSAQALYLTTYKLLTKKVLQLHGLPFPAVFDPECAPGDGLFIVKSQTEDASVGITQSSIVPAGGVAGIIENRQSDFGGQWFAEEYIDGREFNLGLLADGGDVRVLPVAEIVFDGYGDKLYPIVGYSAKWQENYFEYEHSERVFVNERADCRLVGQLKKLALRCWEVFQLSGYARVDFRVDKDNRPWILEINCNPGLDPESGFVAGCLKAGLNYSQLLLHMLRNPRLPAGADLRCEQAAALFEA